MRTLCVVVLFLLGFVPVCRAAPLTCEKLLTPGDQGPNLLGRWYLQAISTDSCIFSTIMHAFQWSSIVVEFTLKETPNLYDVTVKLQILGYCMNKSMPVFVGNNTLFEVDPENRPTGLPLVLLPSISSDCIVITAAPEKPFKALFLYSRQKTISEAELKEFEIKAACLKLPTPWGYNTDLDFTNCKNIAECDPNDTEVIMIKKRMKQIKYDALGCATPEFET